MDINNVGDFYAIASAIGTLYNYREMENLCYRNTSDPLAWGTLLEIMCIFVSSEYNMVNTHRYIHWFIL